MAKDSTKYASVVLFGYFFLIKLLFDKNRYYENVLVLAFL